ncbi:Hypothetical predicted protein [Pelobates cultripes]|uniref:Olfactomedin-like domain-containing protein n=1 Tax=Pelobates cultripes TaxID=61616 RepID=A0AAD1SY80_PELCU|nr:Hypothetical predicted protein [Pelobates cultripes]
MIYFVFLLLGFTHSQTTQPIRNISILVHQLESYDKNNVLVIRREIVALQKRLEECQSHVSATPLPPVDYDGQQMYMFCTYSSYLLLYRTHAEKSLSTSDSGQGGGVIIFYTTTAITPETSVDLKTYTVTRLALTDSTYNNQFSYSSSAWQDIDMAADEDGF